MEIIVDWNNPSDLKKTITKLQKRRKELLRNMGYVEARFQSSKINVADWLPVIEAIIDTNINDLYSQETNERNYYVYVHCDPTKRLNIQEDLRHILLASRFKLNYVPIYVGKGFGDRWLDLSRNDSHRKIRTNIIRKGEDLKSIKIAENLTLSEALALESKLIDCLGLKCLSQDGMLTNLDEGKDAMFRRSLYPLMNGKTKKFILKNGFKFP